MFKLQNTNSANNGTSNLSFVDPAGNTYAVVQGTNLTDASNNGFLQFFTSSATQGLTERAKLTDAGTFEIFTGNLSMISGTTVVKQNSVAIGTTDTTGRDAGISTATGTIMYNTTTSKPQIYTGASGWKDIKISVGPLTMAYLVIGGGGAGGGDFRSGGGGAGALRTNWNNENQGGGQSSGAAKTLNVEQTYSIIVGSKGTGSSGNDGGDGSSSTFDDIVSSGGAGGGIFNSGDGRDSTGSTGGSGGGGGGGSSGGEGGESGTYGYDGGDGGNTDIGGGGGGAASAGVVGGTATTSGDGGSSINNTITGSTVAYAGGGGAGSYSDAGSNGNGPNGAAEGGGAGAGEGMFQNNGSSGYADGRDATIANRGSGGGGASGAGEGTGGDGSDGVIIIRVPSDYSPTFTNGVTYSTATVGSDKVYTITATSNSSQTVTFE